jgi:hypothetical protein
VIWENEGETLGRPVGTCPRAFTKGAAAPKLDGAVPAEMRRHPRRTSVATNGSAARPPPCLLRQSERKVNFVDNLVGKSDCRKPPFHHFFSPCPHIRLNWFPFLLVL